MCRARYRLQCLNNLGDRHRTRDFFSYTRGERNHPRFEIGDITRTASRTNITITAWIAKSLLLYRSVTREDCGGRVGLQRSTHRRRASASKIRPQQAAPHSLGCETRRGSRSPVRRVMVTPWVRKPALRQVGPVRCFLAWSSPP